MYPSILSKAVLDFAACQQISIQLLCRDIAASWTYESDHEDVQVYEWHEFFPNCNISGLFCLFAFLFLLQLCPLLTYQLKWVQYHIMLVLLLQYGLQLSWYINLKEYLEQC